MAGALLAVGTLAGCRPPHPPLRLGSIVFTGHEPVFVARAMNWLDPAAIRLIELHSNTDTLRAIAAGQLEGAQLTLDEFLSARAGGVDLRIVAVLDESRGADAVIARPGLRDPERLQGRRFAVEEGAVGAVMLSALLRHHGLEASDIKKVAIQWGDTVDSFKAGAADYFVTAEPWVSQLEGLSGQRVFRSSAVPGRIVDVMAVRSDTIATREDAVQALVSAHFQAVELLRREPARAAELMAPRLQVAPAEVAGTLKGLFQPDARASLNMMRADGELRRNIRALEQVMLEDGLLTRLSPEDTLFETRFHPVRS